MTIPALRDFVLKQGPSRNLTYQDWTTIWATNKKLIDPVAPRYTAVEDKHAVTGTIANGPAEPYTEEKPKHAKNPAMGTKKVTYGSKIILDQEDVKLFAKDEEITLMNWGNAIVRNIVGSNPVTSIELELHLDGDVKKTDKKVTWLSSEGQTLVPAELKDFGYLITKNKLEEDDNWEDFVTKGKDFYSVSEAVVDENAKELKAGDIIQLERKGYYRVDEAYAGPGKPIVLFNIPTGKASK
jgi:glutamyl-tRNA synthetase